MIEQFDFGFGLVPAHRHVNGGGWVAESAHVDDTAYVGEFAFVSGNAHIYGNARVYGNAVVSGNAYIFGDTYISGDATVNGDAHVTKTPITIIGLEFPVTICDAPYISVGCHIATLEEWETGYCPQKAPLLEAARDHLVALARIHHAIGEES